MTATEFYDHISEFPEIFENRDLEEYLLALYKIIEDNKNEPITYGLILTMLKDAFTSDLYNFQNEWLNCNIAPDENRMSKKFTNPEISSSIDKSNSSDLSPYDFTIEVLKFQIAELHKMRGKQLDNEYRFFGIESETGNYWYNFDPFENLICGARCLEDNDVDFDSLDWSFIGELLENGRIYE